MKRIFLPLCLLICLTSWVQCTTTNKQAEPSNLATENADLAQLSSSIKENPTSADLYYKRSMVFRQVKKDSLALSDLHKAIKLDSTKSFYYSAIADILFEHKDINGSVQWIQKAISLNPDDPTAHLKIAKMFLFTQEYPKAFTEINTVLRTDVYNAEAYFLKGMCYKNMKDTNKAISSFQTSVQSDPTFAQAHMQLALLFTAKHNPLAIQYFENAYRADSSDMEPLYGEAMFWQNQQKYAEAKQVFKRCILLNKDYERAYYNTGWMLLQEDSVEKAIRHFGMAIQVKQDYADAYYNRGLCYEILGKKDSAIIDYKQALVFSPDLASCQTALQRIQHAKK